MTTPKLLLADDSASVRKIVEMTFAAEGIDVTAVGDAQSAMLTFIDLQPDIVLLDVGLAGTSGYQICEMIKQDDATKHIPVLLLVGAYEPFDEGLAKQSAANGYFTKPLIPIRNLVDEVRALLGMSKSPDTAPAEEGTESNALVDHEAHDIEELYSDSISDDPQLKGDDLNDIYLIPMGDDDLIETSPLRGREFVNRDQTSELSWDDDINESLGHDSDRDVEGSEQEEPQFSGTVRNEADVGSGSGSTGDVLIHDLDGVEDRSPAEQFSENGTNEEVPGVEDPYPVSWPHIEDAGETLDVRHRDAQWENESDENPSHVEHEQPDEQAAPGELQQQPIGLAGQGEIDQTIEAVQHSVPDPETLANKADGIQPASAELIEQITQRVIQRLSDRVIREIAQETVPQIAEKLIREALEEEKKV